MTLSGTKEFCVHDLEELFQSVNLIANTPAAVLQSAMLHSSHVITAWESGKLIGLIRSMDDGCWRANIDCLIVHKDYQQRGVGTTLLEQMMSALRYVNIVNVYPNDHVSLSIYKHYGFLEIEQGKLLQYYNTKELI